MLNTLGEYSYYTLLSFTNSISFPDAPSITQNSHLASCTGQRSLHIKEQGWGGTKPKTPSPTALLPPEQSQLSLNQTPHSVLRPAQSHEDLQLLQLWPSTLAEPQQHRALWSTWPLTCIQRGQTATLPSTSCSRACAKAHKLGLCRGRSGPACSPPGPSRPSSARLGSELAQGTAGAPGTWNCT